MSSIDPVSTSKSYPPQWVELGSCRAFPRGENLHWERGEDRIQVGVIDNRWPTVVVADGMTSQEDGKTGDLRLGGGELAAKKAVETTYLYLAKELPVLQSVEQVLECLRKTFGEVARVLQQEEIIGATTLLIALLWESAEGTLFWCYAYEGDGFITLFAPTRKLDSYVVSERLLIPQKLERTAGVTRHACSVPPAVGCRLYEPGDLIYVASDGIRPLTSWLRKERDMTLDFLIQSNKENPDEILNTLKECPYYKDDAVWGMINTVVDGDRPEG